MAMAKMEVEFVSSETIRPSSPTPSHLTSFKLSLLDQYANLTYVPVIFHYPPSEATRNINQVLLRLKLSLADTLSIYYPLAGRIKDHVSINCNDEGVQFIETRVNGYMSNFLEQPDLDLLFKLVPSHLVGPVLNHPSLETLVQFFTQANVFACGGITIGFCFLHRIIDGATMNAFLKCWANLSRGVGEKPAYGDVTRASYLFPPNEVQGQASSSPSWLLKEGKSVMRRFVFDNEAIARLKTEAASLVVPYPSRVQVVASFIWKCILKSSVKEDGITPPSVLVSAMNIRSQALPPVSENSIGNLLWLVVVNDNADTRNESGIKGLVSLLKDGFSQIDENFVKRLQGDEGSAFIDKFIHQTHEFQSCEKREAIFFSSLNKFKFTQLDFGWGKPVWINHIRRWGNSVVYINQVILAESGWNGGIEAWLVLGEKEMSVLENDPDFLAFAVANPSIPLSVSRMGE